LKSSDANTRRQASRWLVRIGKPAIPLLQAYLHQSRKCSFCIALIDTLALIGVTLESRHHAEILFTLMIAANTADPAIRRACAKAVALLRQANKHVVRTAERTAVE